MLSSPLPDDMRLWKSLLSIDLSFNELTSVLPSGWPNSMEKINLENNYLTGIVHVASHMTNLKRLQLGNNAFHGSTVPTELMTLTQLGEAK